jgi:CHAD domain-containing protein
MVEYFKTVREALAGQPSPAKLHKIRLASKKIRYTLELFEPCYVAESYKERMTSLKNVQTALGEVNDAVAAGRIAARVMAPSVRRKALRGYLKGRAAAKAEEFRLHWTTQFDAPGRERWWLDFLASPRRVGRSRTPPKRRARRGVS